MQQRKHGSNVAGPVTYLSHNQRLAARATVYQNAYKKNTSISLRMTPSLTLRSSLENLVHPCGLIPF